MARDILTNVPKEPYRNAQGKMIEITHVEVTYYEFRKSDNKRLKLLSIDKVNEFANQKGIDNPFVSAWYDKEEAIKSGWIKE
ncbi:hypothetical protein [Bacillus paranthracis]|uniref:hypothetical protein n=1 Tax=Bacillus paranthracis TaxID=2026186 RepID=UPI003D66010F